MSKIRPSNTAFEEDIFRLIRRQGVYFKTHSRKIFGKPDIVLLKARKAVFLHSDFWHGWRLSTWEETLPNKFWKEKLRKNRIRDQKVVRTLRRKGWKVLVVWEHSIKRNKQGAIDSMVQFLQE